MLEIVPKDRFTKIYLTLWGVCIAIGLLVFVFYKAGFRLNDNFAPIKVGAIELSSNESDIQIFFDNRDKSIAPEKGVYTLSKITPGLHGIVVSKDKFWPWAKTFLVNENSSRALFSFIFPIAGISTETIPPSDLQYSELIKKVRSNIPPREKSSSVPLGEDESFVAWISKNVPGRKISADKTTALFVANNTIYVAWISESEPPPHYFCYENPCKLKIPVTLSVDTVKSLDFYKDRRDVVMFASGTSLYVIEVDREGTQNFQPLFKGVDPYFFKAEDSKTLYIKDGSSLLKASL